MTIIVYTDYPSLDNAALCLKLRPQKAIFIGKDAKKLQKTTAGLTAVFNGRGQNIEIEPLKIFERNPSLFANELMTIVGNNNDCIFDITCGDPTYIAAVGMLCERYSYAGAFRIYRINPRSGSVYDCIKGDFVSKNEPAQLTVTENILLNGGAVYYDSQRPDGTHVWKDDGAFRTQFRIMSKIFTTRGSSYWNYRTSLMCALHKAAYADTDRLHCRTSVKSFLEMHQKMNIGYDNDRKNKFKDFLKEIHTMNLITEYRFTDEEIEVRFVSDDVKRCLLKSGQILELIIYDLFKEAKEDGETIYHDCMTGVCLDWDGEVHKPGFESLDTKNEVDVIAMYNSVPVFVSCKSGNYETEELYKLYAVAEKFGNKYARKVMIVPRIGNDPAAVTMKSRANDMGIAIVPFTVGTGASSKVDFTEVKNKITTLINN